MDGINKPRNPNDLLIFQNIDNEDHEWQFDAIKNPLPYFIAVGETRELPYYIAKLGIDKLIDRILQKQGKVHTSPLFRAELMDKIVIGIKHINYIREKTANEIALEEMQRKKETDPLEELLKKREIEAEKLRAATIAAATPAAPLIQTQGLRVEPIAPQVSNPENPIAPTATALNNIEAPEAVADPERQNVYNLLRTKAHLDLTHVPTKEKLDSISVDQIKKEFADQVPEFANPAAAVVPDTKESLAQPGMPVAAPSQQPGVPLTPSAATQAPVAPVVPTVAPKPTITMNPAAPAAPLLDQQLQQA